MQPFLAVFQEDLVILLTMITVLILLVRLILTKKYLKLVLLLVLVLMLKIMVSYHQTGKWLITFLKEVKFGLIEIMSFNNNYQNTLKVLPFS